MSKQMNYVDKFGKSYPQSYWKPVQINLGAIDKTAKVVFYGYESFEEVGKRIIGEKAYEISGDKFDLYFSSDILNAKGINPFKQADLLANETLDTLSPEGFISFFDGAIDV